MVSPILGPVSLQPHPSRRQPIPLQPAALDLIIIQLFNVIIDVLVGLVPILGDFLDNLFKSNLRNLTLLEDWLLSSHGTAARYHILLMPDGGDFLPPPKTHKAGSGGGWSRGWFGSSQRNEEEDERERERVRGKVDKTRRMRRDEGEFWGNEPVRVPAEAAGAMPAPGSRAGPSGATRSQRATGPVQEGLD